MNQVLARRCFLVPREYNLGGGSFFQTSKMNNIVAVEFCKTQFTDDFDCTTWLKMDDTFGALLRDRNFRLRSTTSRILSNENRKCWGWWGYLWKAKHIVVERPTPYVVIVRQAGTENWFDTDLPPQLPETISKNHKMEQRQAQKEFKRRSRQQLRQQEQKERARAKKLQKKLVKAYSRDDPVGRAALGGKGLTRGQSKYVKPTPDISTLSKKRKANLVAQQYKRLATVEKKYKVADEDLTESDGEDDFKIKKEVTYNPFDKVAEDPEWLTNVPIPELRSPGAQLTSTQLNKATDMAMQAHELTDGNTKVVTV